MGRLVLIGAGVVVGVVGVTRARRLARSYGPEGVHARATTWWDGVRDFADAVREGTAEREAELRAALGVDAAGAGLDPTAARDLLERPTAPRHAGA